MPRPYVFTPCNLAFTGIEQLVAVLPNNGNWTCRSLMSVHVVCVSVCFCVCACVRACVYVIVCVFGLRANPSYRCLWFCCCGCGCVTCVHIHRDRACVFIMWPVCLFTGIEQLVAVPLLTLENDSPEAIAGDFAGFAFPYSYEVFYVSIYLYSCLYIYKNR